MADASSLPRDKHSFGVSGLLDARCKVFYCNLFSPNHVGRISDLLSAQFRRQGPNELRLRALLLFSVFEAYSNRVGSPTAVGSAQAGILAQPITLECGIDDEHLAIGVAVEMPATAELPDSEALSRRVRNGETEGEIERFVGNVQGHCDRVVIRVHRATRRVEVVALIATSDTPAARVAEIEVIYLTEAVVPEAPRAASYTELGDLDYLTLLKPDVRAKRDREATGDEETRVGGDSPTADDSVVRVGGSSSKDEVVRRISNASNKEDAVIRVSGGVDQEEEENQVIKGSGEKAAESEYGRGSSGSGITQLFKKIWRFAKKSTEAEEEGEARDEVSESGAEPSLGAETDSAMSEATEPAGPSAEGEAAPPVPGEPAPNAEAAARSLMIELQNGNLNRTIDKAQREMVDIKADLKTNRAQRWAEGLMAELLSEKARLGEIARKLNAAVRLKEVEFRNKETGLKEEIRRRDEALRQKESAIARAKDQVVQLRMAMERLKASQVEAGDEVHYRQKYNFQQKLYNSAKEENTKLTAQLEQLKTEAANLRYAAKKGEEYKKQYLAIADKAADKTSGGAAANAARRADAEAKMAAVYRKEASDLRSRVNELQLKTEESEREEARLKKEIARLQAEAKAGGKGNAA